MLTDTEKPNIYGLYIEHRRQFFCVIQTNYDFYSILCIVLCMFLAIHVILNIILHNIVAYHLPAVELNFPALLASFFSVFQRIFPQCSNVPVLNVSVSDVPISNVPVSNVSICNVPVSNVSVSNVPVSNVAALQKEQEILEAIDVSAAARPVGLPPLENVLAGMKFVPTTTTAAVASGNRRQEEGLDAQVVRALGTLPDLSFMTANGLMFPIRGDTN